MRKVLLNIIIFSLFLSGCTPTSQPKANTNQGESHIKYTDCLTLSDIKTAFAREDLKLIENKKESPVNYKLGSVMPAIFNIEGSNQIVLIYVFSTIADRKQVCLFGGLRRTLDVPEKASYHPIREFTIRNILLIDMINGITLHAIKPKDKQVLKSLDQISFTLNNSQKVIFADKGTYWDAQYIVDYYQHWYKDKRGFAEVDQYSNENWMVKYIGSNLQSKDLRYEYTSPSGSGYGDGFYVKKGDSYYLIVGGGASNGSIPDKNSVLTLTIKWGGKEESLKLRAVNEYFPFPANSIFINQSINFL